MSTKNIIYSIILLTSATLSLCAQSTDGNKITALNNYINFTNESTHGLLIVHRLLENFNKNINKYVDLPDQPINFYSNKDLPKDIFEDTENWFYDTSPNEWYEIITKSSGVFPQAQEIKLKAISADMKSILVAVNKIRFDLESQINTLDLSKRENLSLVYDKLEEGVKLYKTFFDKQLILEREIKANYQNLNVKSEELVAPTVVSAVSDIYQTMRAALVALYNKDDNQFADLIKAQEVALQKFNAIDLAAFKNTRLINPKIQLYWSNIKRQAAESIKVQKAFADSENVPVEYKLYGKYYYYYNIAIINKFNRYGNGIVFETNRIIEFLNLPLIRNFELPHYFKVVYPKLLDSTAFLESADPVIKTLPKVVKGRNVVTATRTIKVDKEIVDFDMYDHKIVDKDVVSLSFNGDWIVEKFQISEKPYKFTLKLNSEGKNFLLLHADDMGRQPPATVALSYIYKGKKELIILNSDTVKSEVIEIVLQK
ncbi:MAG: hypothetical protein IPL55_11295 [Saprospiraceae bacterium]|jgi:hypothetical protein|nr:hypothetical protein [Saprospiraceae bacterium]MBL0024546.1 hypothetical protein [Saprospiraceae bacterium]